MRSVALSAAVLEKPSAVVVASLEGNPMGGAEKRDANYFGKKAITIARAPSVIDHGVGPQRLCVCVRLLAYEWVWDCEHGERRGAAALTSLDWVCAGVIKRLPIKSDDYCGRKY